MNYWREQMSNCRVCEGLRLWPFTLASVIVHSHQAAVAGAQLSWSALQGRPPEWFRATSDWIGSPFPAAWLLLTCSSLGTRWRMPLQCMAQGSCPGQAPPREEAAAGYMVRAMLNGSLAGWAFWSPRNTRSAGKVLAARSKAKVMVGAHLVRKSSPSSWP